MTVESQKLAIINSVIATDDNAILGEVQAILSNGNGFPGEEDWDDEEETIFDLSLIHI